MVDIIALVMVLLSLVQGPLIAEGKATHYCQDCPRAMHNVIPNRWKWDQVELSHTDVGYVALADCGRLGERVVIELPDGRLIGPLLVADCGATKDQEHLEKIGFAVDLSWELAVELDTVYDVIHGVRVYEWRGE